MTVPLGALTAGDVEPGRYRLTGAMSSDVLRRSVDALRREMAETGWIALTLRGAAVHDRASLFDEFVATAGFPDWFGANWDALADCLSDLSWLPPGPTVIFWDRSDVLARADPPVWRTAGQVIDAAIASRVAGGLPPLYVIYPPPGNGVSRWRRC